MRRTAFKAEPMKSLVKILTNAAKVDYSSSISVGIATMQTVSKVKPEKYRKTSEATYRNFAFFTGLEIHIDDLLVLLPF